MKKKNYTYLLIGLGFFSIEAIHFYIICRDELYTVDTLTGLVFGMVATLFMTIISHSGINKLLRRNSK